MSIFEDVRRAIRRDRLIEPGARVLAAVSGGADSVALLLVLQQLAPIEGFTLAGVAHLNHQLRAGESDEDEAFCRRLAERLSLPCDVERVDAGGLARSTRISVEHAGHDARHAFFARAAERANASLVAVAHTRDDQAETVLLRLLRGAGTRGLGGIHPRAGIVVRPFLGTSRHQIREFLHAQAVVHREDASNGDTAIPRNRVRHELIPLLRDRFSSNLTEVLDRVASIARDDEDFLEAASTEAAARLIRRVDDRVEVSAADLLAEPVAISRRVVRMAQQMVAGGRFVGFDATQAVLELAVSNSLGPVDLPGHRANRVGENLVLSGSHGRRTKSVRENQPRGFRHQLDVPGRVDVPEAGCVLTAASEVMPPAESAMSRWPLSGRGDSAVVEADGLAAPLVVRNRQAGDRFRPLGMRGHKTLQDLFVDAKIGRDRRDSIPVVVDATGQIVWVVGVAVGEQFRVTDRTRAVVVLKRMSSSKMPRSGA